MKIMIVSDTHRRHSNLKLALEREKPIDLLIHLGDAEGAEDEIADMAGCPLEIVSGNSDFFSMLPREKEIELAGYHILLTHGHYYYVTAGMEDIKKEAYGRGMDIVMFGHTHRPLIDESDGIIAINPGSISSPRQEGRQPSYIIMDIHADGVANFTIKYIKRH